MAPHQDMKTGEDHDALIIDNEIEKEFKEKNDLKVDKNRKVATKEQAKSQNEIEMKSSEEDWNPEICP